MSVDIIEAGRLMWRRGMVDISGKPKSEFREWLNEKNYAPAVIDRALELQPHSYEALLTSICSDINRFSRAGSESLLNVVYIERIPNSLGWPCIKLYYSAFFYAHSLLRLWGLVPSYFNTQDLLPIKDIIRAYDLLPPFQLENGGYICRLSVKSGCMNLEKLNSRGGTHGHLWKVFLDSLTEWYKIIDSAPYLEEDKNRIKKTIKTLISIIKNNNSSSYNWLSEMRNKINYRHSDGLWFPYAGKHRSDEFADRIKKLIKNELDFVSIINVSDNELVNFKSACLSIIFISRELLKDMKTIGGNNSFIKYGHFYSENHANI